jgi:hypothetical protein
MFYLGFLAPRQHKYTLCDINGISRNVMCTYPDPDLECHVFSSFIKCVWSVIPGERILFVLLILMDLFTLTVYNLIKTYISTLIGISRFVCTPSFR